MNISFRMMIVVAIFLLCGLMSPRQAHAATPATMMMETMDTMAEAESMTATPTPMVSDYVLPYPGILPDHPLYVFKKIRDQILERLIADPMRRMEFYMLQADKGVNTAVFLSAKQRDDLADQSLMHAQGSLQKAVAMAQSLKAQGTDVAPYMIERFGNALAKYEAVMMEMTAAASEDRVSAMATMISSFKALQSDIDVLKQ